MYRFWIENELWYALNCADQMPECGKEYLDHYRQLRAAEQTAPTK